MRVAVRTPNWLGDAILALPAVADLHASFPGADVDYYATGAIAAVYDRLGLGGRIVQLPGREPRGRLFTEAIPILRARRVDLGVLFPPSFSSGLLFLLGGVRKRVGFAGDGRGMLLTHRVARPPRGERHLVEEYRGLVAAAARACGAEPVRAAEPPSLEPLASETERVLDRLRGHSSPWWVLAPGAAYGPTKRWPAASFARLGDRLVETRGGTVVLVGAGADRAIADEVARGARNATVNLAGLTDLGELIALFDRAELVVTNDSGAMHVAAAAGAKLVALFGSTSPEWTGPRSSRSVIVRRHEPCAPCFQPSCRIGIVCLTRIGVDDAWAACASLLGGAA